MEPRLSSGARIAAIASAAMIAQQVAGKATRDAFYLSNFSVTTLPLVMGASAVMSLVAALWLSRMLLHYTPARVVPLGFGMGSAILLATWALSFSAPRVAAVTLYFYTALFGAAVISAFWSLINETFDPHASRRSVSVIASGGTLGGLVGGLAAWRLSSMIAVTTMLPLLAAANAVCMWGGLRVRTPNTKGIARGLALGTPAHEPAFPLRLLRESPYLRNLAAIVALGAVTSGLLDYIFSAEAAKTFAKGPALLSFFAMFWVVVGVLSFILQMAFGRFALEKLGLALNVAILPAIVLLGGTVGLAVPGLLSTSLLRGGEATQRNSLFRAAYEMLYTPLPEGKKRAIKAVIDLGFDRLGTLAAAGLAWAAVWIAGSRAETALLAVVMVCALVSLTQSRPLHLGYVLVLEDSLRRGVEDGAISVTIPPGAVTLVARDEVVDVLDVVLPPQPHAAQEQAAAALRARDESSARDIADLSSRDVDRGLRALAAEKPLGRTVVAFAILRLADKQLCDQAMRALRRTASLIPGQLADALCDPAVEFDIRRRIPRVLSECPTQQVADSLLRGAEDDRFEVRYECGRALLKITQANSHIVIPPERVIAIVKLEVSLDRRVWESQPPPEFDDDTGETGEPVLIGRLLRDRLDRSLEHVFTLLALHIDRGSLVIAFKALHTGDEHVRGTALEYLETVLPDEVRDAVWPYLGEQRPMRPPRAASEILADLERSAAGASAEKSLAAPTVAFVREVASAPPTRH